jgi:uncharacterized protein YggE
VKSRFVVFLVVVVGALLLVGCGSSSGKTVVSNNGGEGLNVNGQGSVYGSPDMADIDVGVQVPALTADEARSKAAVAMDALLTSVKGNGIADADIRTSQFSVDPQYGYAAGENPYQGGVQTVRGYQVTNVVTVRIRKIETVSKIVDEATIAGGSFAVVRRVSYGMLETKKLQTQARELAIKEARERAEELASLSGRKVGKAIQVNESTNSVQYNPYSYLYGNSAPVVSAPRTGSDSTSIESGQLRVVINVSVNFELKD